MSSIRLFATLLLASGAGLAQAQAPDYSELDSWLCHPENNQDACDRDLNTTVIAADGSLQPEPFQANDQRPVDCFYVYPTTSLDETANSDLNPGEMEEIITAHLQTARLRQQCRVFAPMYRQITIPALRKMMQGKPMGGDRAMTYNDVRNAWQYYLENENNGRGVILVGHSQGAGLLNQLIAREIDGKPVQQQLVSAILSGTSVQVPEGETKGGTFKQIPLCESAGQTGCVITFSSYRDRIPPAPNALFGRNASNTQAACTNPANLGGDGKAELHAYLSTIGEISASFGEYQPWTVPEKPVETPFVSLPGMIHGECVEKDGFHYLEISVQADPNDGRADDIVGDLYSNGEINTGWGLHLIDMSLVMGNLVDIVEQQVTNYQAQ